MTLLVLLISTAPMVMGVMFAIRPNERRLALMRPLSLAGIFAGVCNLLVGLANALRAMVEASVVRSARHADRLRRAHRSGHPDIRRRLRA